MNTPDGATVEAIATFIFERCLYGGGAWGDPDTPQAYYRSVTRRLLAGEPVSAVIPLTIGTEAERIKAAIARPDVITSRLPVRGERLEFVGGSWIWIHPERQCAQCDSVRRYAATHPGGLR